MIHVKAWDKEEDDYTLFTTQSNKKNPRNNLNDVVGPVGNFGHKAAECLNKKATKVRAQKKTLSTKRNSVLKETTKEKDIMICQKNSMFLLR